MCVGGGRGGGGGGDGGGGGGGVYVRLEGVEEVMWFAQKVVEGPGRRGSRSQATATLQ